MAILNSVLGKSQNSVSLGPVIREIAVIFWWCHDPFILHAPYIFACCFGIEAVVTSSSLY